MQDMAGNPDNERKSETFKEEWVNEVKMPLLHRITKFRLSCGISTTKSRPAALSWKRRSMIKTSNMSDPFSRLV